MRLRARDGALGLATALTFGVMMGGQAPHNGAVQLTPDEMRFSREGLALDGMGQANLVGDPSKPGPYTVRLQFPDSYELGPHSHPDPREVTVLSGTWLTGYGDRFNANALKALPAGSFYTEPANMPHFARTKGKVLIQVSGVGPSARVFVASEPLRPSGRGGR